MFSATIIVPTWHYFQNPFKLQPIMELHFATVLEDYFHDKNVKISVIDLRELRREKCEYSIDNIKDFIPESDLYINWILKSGDFYDVIKVTEQLRQAYPNAKHVAGGMHISNMQDECMKILDAIIIGAGEQSFIDIVEDCMDNKLKQIYNSPWGECHLSKYGYPRRSFLDESSIIGEGTFENYGNLRSTCVMFSRGCPFQCIMCNCKFPNIPCQVRDAKSIVQEIKYLKQIYKIKAINLRDELCIPIQKDLAKKQIDAIGESNIKWRGQGSVVIGKELLKSAKESGLLEIAVGVESASQKVLEIINKKQTIKQARDFIITCKEVGIKIKTCFIFGLPGEPRDIVEITKKFIDETQPDYASVSGLCLFPGTEMFNNPGYYGIQYIDKNWSHYGHLMCRYSDEEHFGVPFRYAEENKWGKTFSRQQIIDNVKEMQHYLQEKDKVW